MFPVLFPILTVAGFGLAFGIILAYAAKRIAPEVNKTEKELYNIMPGINCGACGYAGCVAYANAIIKKKEEINKCSPGGEDLIKRISELLGLEAVAAIPRIAAVHCQGGKNSSFKADYHGINTCAGEFITAGNRSACEWGCLGYGDCVEVCPFDAIHMGDDQYPIIDREKCTGCGKCVTACPKDIISLIPATQKIYLGCRNPQKGKIVKEICSKGCIGCRICSLPKITPSGKVTMKGHLPDVPEDWEDFEQAVLKCPGKCFVVLEKVKKEGEKKV